MADEKKAATQHSDDAKSDAKPAKESDKKQDPYRYLVLDLGDGVSFDVILGPDGWSKGDRRFSHAGQNWEHVRDDQYGRWVYRAM